MTTEDQSTEMPGTDEFWEKDEGVQNLDFGAAELQQLQHSDESLAEIWQLLKNGHLEWVEKYSLIYRVKGQLGKEEEAERRKQLVLNAEKQFSRWPTKFQWRDTWEKAGLLRGCCSGSTGQTFTKDVANFCQNCARCQKAHNRRGQPVPIVPLPIMLEPFSRIAMDIVGPLPRSSRGHKYILVICDYATRYPEAVPLRTCDAEALAEELGKLFSRVGIPKEILTDQGMNFTSQLLAELYHLLNVHSIRTTPYHPQTDGLVGRFNQTLKAMLRRT